MRHLIVFSGAFILGAFWGSSSDACGEYYDCEAPSTEYSESDVEGVWEAAIEDSFAHCGSILESAARLSCYDEALQDAGFIVKAALEDQSS